MGPPGLEAAPRPRGLGSAPPHFCVQPESQPDETSPAPVRRQQRPPSPRGPSELAAQQNSGHRPLEFCGQVPECIGGDLGVAWSPFVSRAGPIQPPPIALLPQGLIRSMSGPLHSVRFASLPCCP